MRRAVIAWAGIGLLLLAAGCTMCAGTYDYCGPVVDGSCNCPCDTRVRTGSILGGASADVVEGGQMTGEVIEGQEVVGQPGAGPTIVGEPVTTDDAVISESGTAEGQPVLTPVPAGARRHTRAPVMR
jgi:hypothetical protein